VSPENLEEHMKYHEAMGERSYSLMYDAFSGTAAAGHYSDVKHEFAEAIRFAREAGRADEILRLEQRLKHIQEVFRSQFS
jgi:hypothetical protein